jgi:glucose-1-phosphate adenylyltransferase
MVSGGCIVSGALVRNSVLFSNCKVRSYSRVEHTVLLPDVLVGQHCDVRRAILDRGVELPDGTQVGVDHEADRARGFRVTETGLTLVTPDMLGQNLHFTR